MSRQVKRWIAMGVLAAILAFTFIQLGEWQLRRLDERRDRNATVLAHESLPVQDYSAVMTKEIGEDDAKRADKRLADETKRAVDTIDELLKAKETELMEV